MMIGFVRKNVSCLILNPNSPFLSKSPFPFSLPLHFSSTSTDAQPSVAPTVYDILLHKFGFPPELSSQVASQLTHLHNPEEKADLMLSFFKNSGFSNAQIEKILKYLPRLLGTRLEGLIKPKIKILQDLGFSSGDVAKLVSSNPRFLHLSLQNNIIPSLSVMRGLFGSDNEVARVLRMSPRFLSSNLHNTVLPNVEFLKNYGIPMERIRIILIGHPLCFTSKPEILRRSAEKAIEMGLDASSNSFLYAIPALSKMSDDVLEHKLQAFRNLGFSDDDIVTMFRKDPRVFSVSMDKIRKVLDLLLASGKFNMSDIVDLPNAFSLSVENRFIPRLQILEILEARNLITSWPTLSTIFTSSNDKFFKKFVGPYFDDVSGIWIAKSSRSLARRR